MTFATGFEVEYVYYIAPDGIQYPLFGGSRVLMRFAGLGMPNINYITDSGPFVQGERVRDFKLDARIIDFVLYERGCSRQDRWDNLGNIVDSIRMNRGGAGKIIIVLPDFSEREIDAWILDGPRVNWQGDSSLVPFDINEPLRFIAPYPIWSDPVESETIHTGDILSSCLPLCLSTCIGSAVINTSFDIDYIGTFESFPTIEITGSLDSPLIENVTTGKKIQFLYNIGVTEVVTVELTPDQALVYNNFGDNLIGVIEDTNDLSTFSIEPEGLNVPGGVNTIRLQGSGGTLGTTQILLLYEDMYLAVPR